MANTPQQSFSSYQVGQPDTLEYRVFFKGSSGPISPFHDIPLWADKNHKIANMVVEIPKGTQPKLEINKDEFMNPIKQDVKNGKLRIVALKYPFNYGAFPQTWENPSVVHPDTKAKGDNDPVDVVEISSSVFKTGEVRQVKILGTYAMIDEGETDWKVLVIDVNDPLASQLNDAADIDKVMPGKTKEVFEFLRDYKIPDGKPANQFAFDSALQNRAFALNIVDETHHGCEFVTRHRRIHCSSISRPEMREQLQPAATLESVSEQLLSAYNNLCKIRMLSVTGDGLWRRLIA